MNYPVNVTAEAKFKVLVNDKELQILKTSAALFIPAMYENCAKIKFITYGKYSDISISPKRINIQVEKTHDGYEFQLTENLNLCITLEGLDIPVFFYGDTPKQYDGNADYFFKSGAVYDAGEICLTDNQSIYIEAGAVVRGCISAKGAKNIKVYGQGILDGSFYDCFAQSKRSICFNLCENVEIKDIIMIEPTTWMIALFGCKNVHIDNVKQIGEVMCSDGVDIVGCADVLVENCMFRNNDDCVAIKHLAADCSEEGLKYLPQPKNIWVKNCVFWNNIGGNGIEIGHELRCDIISDIKFTDIDILRVEGNGAALSIHAGDRAKVCDILFENIYIEHYDAKIFDFRVMKSRFNLDKEYGSISDITLRNIHITSSINNAGYAISIIGGHDKDHKASNIYFEDVYINGEKLMSLDTIDLYTKHTENLMVK